MKTLISSLIVLFTTLAVYGQSTLSGTIVGEDGRPLDYATVILENSNRVNYTSDSGEFIFKNLDKGKYSLEVSYLGYETYNTIVEVFTDVDIDISLDKIAMDIDEVVVTGTKTPIRKTDSPVIVNVINSKTLSNVQACNLSESLKFQPGLRVETDCQTCNYTQLRMNGLAGGYSQILINGRPIFSPLTGLYGMEQLPTNMIDRIEIVRGGGSSLYGSSAIGGTVNVITKIPKTSNYSIDYIYQNIDGQANDNTINGNATLVSENKNSGVSFFMNHRERDFYDANNDNFSEIPLVENTSIGTSFFFIPKENQKIEFNVSNVQEYRFGGEMNTTLPAYLTLQSEERKHNVWMGGIDYQINFNDDNSSLITYFGAQSTDRKHYTGIQPEKDTNEYDDFVSNPPYGTSKVKTFNVGTQLNHKLNSFLKGENVLTFGAEYTYDEVDDKIPSYNYLIDQKTNDLGFFVQSDWKIIPKLTLLSGVRVDKHSLIDAPVINPRMSLLYKVNEAQFRVSYGTGFRAPQAFDADLHIAFAGGGVSRVTLSPELSPEKSQSLSASINYDKIAETWIAGFTIEGFYNKLNDAFYLQPIGEDQYGELFEKQNGDGATVQGATLELRANYNQKIQLESGFTLQTSKFDSPVEYIDGIEGIREFVRTPNHYGYGILTLTPNSRWSSTLNYVYTGNMKVPHFAGAPNQTTDEIITSKPFSEFSAKLAYTIPMPKFSNNLEIYGGVKNIFNAYQQNFDIGKNRDSNFVYGPSQPRVYYLGIKIRS